MSIVTKTERSEEKSELVSEVYYTICSSLFVSSSVAVENGLLEQELQKVGVGLRYLRSLPDEKWISHFNHQLPNLFREGGNVPPIWARSRGEDTKLIGLTFNRGGGEIAVRAKSDIRKVSDLRGRKIGLPTRLQKERVDFWRATSERGILLALELAGLRESDVEIIDLPVEWADTPSSKPVRKPSEAWNRNKLIITENEALLNGSVDAIYTNSAKTLSLQEEGKVKVIEDLSRYPDWTLQLANSPATISVNGELARNHPEIVIAYLKAIVKAGRWINDNPLSAGEIFMRVTHFPDAETAGKNVAKFNLVPGFSGKNITAIEIEKKFLLERGYISNDFDVKDWIDSSFLEEALKEN